MQFGIFCGFAYVVQKDVVMHTLTIVSRTMTPSPDIDPITLDNMSRFDRQHGLGAA